MRSGSSLRLSRLVKSNPSVVGCFIGTEPFSRELWFLCDMRSCAIMLLLTCFCRALLVMPQWGIGFQPRVAASATLGKESDLVLNRNAVASACAFLSEK